MKKGIFLSLKWKVAVIVASVFLLLHSLFSYHLYLDASEDFLHNRQNIQNRYKRIAHALIEDSFLVLTQFAELVSSLNTPQKSNNNPAIQITATLDGNWQQWQYIWGLESAVFFDQKGQVVKQWGAPLNAKQLLVSQTLKTELPSHQIICPDICFQMVMIPVMANSKLMGVFGIRRSFADIVIEYERVTGSDIGVLVKDEQSKILKWPYQISVMTNIEQNRTILANITQEPLFDQVFKKRKEISVKERIFDISVFPVRSNREQLSPVFLIIDEITDERNAVVSNLQSIWIYGIVSLFFSLSLLLLVLFISLRRVVKFSDALPLLAEKRYEEFRGVLGHRTNKNQGYDELDLLNDTALELSNQLEGLEKEIKKNIFQLVEQGQELMTERDFSRQLIDVAPILVFTQDVNGVILSINQAVVNELGQDENSILGGVFDNYIPEIEFKHLAELRKLRAGDFSEHLKIDGVLISSSTVQKKHVSWTHSIVRQTNEQCSFIILSLGVDISERKKVENQMLQIATHDQLTGLSNRRDFQVEFAREIATAKRNEQQLALFYLDLDQFKVVNDTNGHEVGDSLLRLVSETLREVVRETDVLSRIGGDEFTLIMPNSTEQGIVHVALKINESLGALDFWVADKQYKVSTSIGIAIYPIHGTDEHELLSNADLAMYRAKESAYGQYHIFSPENDYQSGLKTRLYWKNIIEEGLKEERFILLFQPILDMKTNKISHYECLSRIKNEQGGFHMPGDFIGFAEELGLIGQIDRMVLKKVIEQHKRFEKQGKNIKLAVNFSGRSFSDETIFEDIKALLSQPEVNPEQIIFEITETAAVSNFSSAQILIEKIKALGCSLALDDFGVGFSSFYYLKYLPVEYVKIDGSFIKQLDTNYEDKVFVKALTDVSQALGKKTIAEFVENEAILSILKEFGIDYAQGYHIGKPANID